MFERLSTQFDSLHQWLFIEWVQPALFTLGLGGHAELAFDETELFLIGLLQIALLLLVVAPLQRWRPVEAQNSPQARAAIRLDVGYTLLHRLGFFKLVMFFTFAAWFEALAGYLRTQGLPTLHLDELMGNVLPWLAGSALASFVLYLVVLDFANYWVHRAQHQIHAWWALHSLHHAQQTMNMWSDNRNHLLDDVLRDLLFAALALLIGISPGQFVWLVAFMQLSESLQHANLRLSFGRWGERLWVSPRFHRLHHSVGLGHETLRSEGTSSEKVPVLGGHNFGVLLPWWDIAFGTANFENRYDATGIRDQVEQGRDYGTGFWQQQWLGLRRMFQ